MPEVENVPVPTPLVAEITAATEFTSASALPDVTSSTGSANQTQFVDVALIGVPPSL